MPSVALTPTRPPEEGLDRIRLEVFRSALVAAADEMSLALQRAAYSTNIKTRLDFSCAVFDRSARVIAQSFTQPVHLGTLVHFVPRVIDIYGRERLRPGDGILCNDGHLGGLHLNDVCLLAPILRRRRAGRAYRCAGPSRRRRRRHARQHRPVPGDLPGGPDHPADARAGGWPRGRKRVPIDPVQHPRAA